MKRLKLKLVKGQGSCVCSLAKCVIYLKTKESFIFPSSQQMGGTNSYRSWLWREETEFVSCENIWCHYCYITSIVLDLMLLKSSGGYQDFDATSIFQLKTLWKWGQDKFCSSDSICILSSGVTDILQLTGVTQ